LLVKTEAGMLLWRRTTYT